MWRKYFYVHHFNTGNVRCSLIGRRVLGSHVSRFSSRLISINKQDGDRILGLREILLFPISTLSSEQTLMDIFVGNNTIRVNIIHFSPDCIDSSGSNLVTLVHETPMGRLKVLNQSESSVGTTLLSRHSTGDEGVNGDSH